MDKLRKYFIITFGTMIVAFAVSVFYTPNKIVGEVYPALLQSFTIQSA